jgi:hypothetical protein
MNWNELNWEDNAVWVLAHATETMQRYIRRKYPHSYEVEIQKYETPIKLIRSEEQLIAISVTDEFWGGIQEFQQGEYLFITAKTNLVWLRNTKAGRKLVEVTGEQSMFWKAMTSTPWLSRDELDWARQRANVETLPRITFGPL